MALQMNVTLDAYGVSLNFPNAYARVEAVDGVHEPANSVATVTTYRDATRAVELKTMRYGFPLDLSDGASNPWRQAYEHLKTLPEFSGALDV